MKDHRIALLIIFFLVILIFILKGRDKKEELQQQQHIHTTDSLKQVNEELIKQLNRQKHLALLIYNHADPKSMKKDTTLTRIMLTGDNQ